MAARRVDVAVVGAGPGGYAAAFRAAELGLRVALVDPEPAPGGVCLHRGCIPSKALLHLADVIERARSVHDAGLVYEPPRIDLDRMRGWTHGVVERLTGGLAGLARRRGVEWIRATGRLLGPHRLRVDRVDGGREELAFEHAILATGSVPVTLPDLPGDTPRILDSTRALALETVPERLLVVGGGYIGLELGSVYAALGSRVTVVEMTAGLLPGVDRDLVKPLQARLEKQLAGIHCDTKVAGAREEDDGIHVRLEGAGADEAGTVFDRVLVAVGRRPNGEALGLETTAVRTDARGFVAVDEARRTHEPSLFAIGDLAGEPMLAHKATHEGRVAAEAIAGRASAFAPLAIPAVVFTDPEIAWCGLSEQEARRSGVAVKVTRFPWRASGRAMTLGRVEGVSKLVLAAETGRVLGAGVCGPGAGELVAELGLAVEMGATARDLALTIHAHPTLSETWMEAAELFHGQATHLHRTGRAADTDEA